MNLDENQGPKSPVVLKDWGKSSYSNSQGNCLEEAVVQGQSGTTALVRDTQNREAGHLAFGATEWGAVLKAAV